MFNRKLKEKVEWLEAQVGIQRQKIKQLECSHHQTKFVLCDVETGLDEDGHIKVVKTFDVICCNCDKFIRQVGDKEKVRMEYEQAKEQYNKICGGSDEH